MARALCMVETVNGLILDDRIDTIKNVSTQLGISVGRAHKIVPDFSFSKISYPVLHQDNKSPHTAAIKVDPSVSSTENMCHLLLISNSDPF